MQEHMVQCAAAQAVAEVKPSDAFATCLVQQASDGRVTVHRQGVEPPQPKTGVPKLTVYAAFNHAVFFLL